MCDFVLKTITIGDTNIGKTTILGSHNFNKMFLEATPTIGVEFFTTVINWNKKKVKLQVWDCSGDPIYFDIISSYFNNVVAAMVFFDLSNRESFNNIEKWINEFIKRKQPYSYILIVGNYKEGIIEVSGDDIRKICNKYKAGYAEVNCKNTLSIAKMFSHLVEVILEENRMNPKWYKNNPGLKTNYRRLPDIDEEPSSGCCKNLCVIL